MQQDCQALLSSTSSPPSTHKPSKLGQSQAHPFHFPSFRDHCYSISKNSCFMFYLVFQLSCKGKSDLFYSIMTRSRSQIHLLLCLNSFHVFLNLSNVLKNNSQALYTEPSSHKKKHKAQSSPLLRIINLESQSWIPEVIQVNLQ